MEFRERVEKIYDEMAGLLESKNASYGGSVFKGEGLIPVVGNMIRLGDKMRRYENLVSKFVNDKILYASSEANPFGESIYDTVRDILGYATLGLMILEDKGLCSDKGLDSCDSKNIH